MAKRRGKLGKLQRRQKAYDRLKVRLAEIASRAETAPREEDCVDLVRVQAQIEVLRRRGVSR